MLFRSILEQLNDTVRFHTVLAQIKRIPFLDADAMVSQQNEEQFLQHYQQPINGI